MGFSSRSQAHSIGKLMREMSQHKNIKVESITMSRIMRLCNENKLDFVWYDQKGEYRKFEHEKTEDVDQMRFLLETTYRYY